MLKWRFQFSRELAIEACRALKARDDAGGCWPNGIPPSFMIIKAAYDLNNLDWVLTVETVVRLAAIQLVVEFEDKIIVGG